MNDSLATAVADFLAHKRALGRKYQTEEATLRLLLAFAGQHGVQNLRQLTPCLLEEFVASRPRERARSFNHLVGILGCLFDWAVTQQLLVRLGRHPAASAGIAVTQNPATGDGSTPALPLRRRPGPSAAQGGRGPSRQSEGHRSRPDLPRHLCPLLRPRAQSRGGVRPPPRRHRHRPATPRRTGRQVRQEPPRPARAAHRRAPQPPARAPTGRRCARIRRTAVQLRRSAQREPRQREPDFPPTRRRAGLPGPRRRRDAPSSLPASLLCRGVPVAVVSGGSRPVDAALPALHVHGPRRPRLHRHLPDHHAPAARRGQPAIRSLCRAGVVGAETVTGTPPLGSLVHSFFLDHLVTVKGLRPASVRSYRDTIRLLLCFVAEDRGTKITKLNLEDLSFERILGFLRHLEHDRHNHVRTRNQRLAALHTLFDYIAGREPQMLGICQQVTAIPMKRAAPAETHFPERDEVEALLRNLPRTGRLALRDHALLLFLYNTGARAQEVADLRAGHLELREAAVVRLHGKGDKWRTCPLWRQTAQLLTELLDTANELPRRTRRSSVPQPARP